MSRPDSRVDRAVSITVNYVLAIAIATILVTGLLIAGGNFIERQQAGVVENELRVVGQRLASDLERVDRLATASNGSATVRLNQTLPNAAAGNRYDITLNADSNPELFLASEAADVNVSIPITNQTDVAQANVNSGTIAIIYNTSGNEELTITNGETT